MKGEVQDLGREVHELESEGVHSILVVPLVVSSYSEVYRQWRYLLGLEPKPGFDAQLIAEMMIHHPQGDAPAGMSMMEMMEPVSPVDHHAEVRFAQPLDDDDVVSEILLQRALELSRSPAEESVVIVAHGPNQDVDNQKWLENLERIAERIKRKSRFKVVEGATLRDDAPSSIRHQAVEQLRGRVQLLGEGHRRVLVVPLLLAQGGIEDKIRVALEGLPCSYSAKTLLPDPRIAGWIQRRSTS